MYMYLSLSHQQLHKKTTRFDTKMAPLDPSSSDDTGRTEDISRDLEDCRNEKGCDLHFSEDEEKLVTIMFSLVGRRWALIAGRIPGRTAEEIQMYWNIRHPTNTTQQ